MTTTSSSSPTTVFITDTSSINGFNRGPITTVFPAPASCAETLTLGTGDPNYLFYGHNANLYVDVDCFPTGSLPSELLISGDNWDYYFYSPAICPQSYTIATTYDGSLPGADKNTLISVGSSTTVGLCCPSGYGYFAIGAGHQCSSTITPNQIVSYVLPTNKGAAGWERGDLTSSTFATGSSVAGDGVPIMWQASDSALLASAALMTPTSEGTTTTTGSSGTTSVPTTGPQTSQSSAIPPPTGGSGGLSTGAKAGIGVAIPVVAIAGLAIGFLLFRRRKRQKAKQAVEIGGDTTKSEGQVHHEQLDSRPIHEMYTDPHEMPSTPPPASPQELPATEHRQ